MGPPKKKGQVTNILTLPRCVFRCSKCLKWKERAGWELVSLPNSSTTQVPFTSGTQEGT